MLYHDYRNMSRTRFRPLCSGARSNLRPASRLKIFSAFRIRWENRKIPTTARIIGRNVKARHRRIRSTPSCLELYLGLWIFQFSQRIMKAEKISNRDADLRFELSPLQSGLKQVCDISRRSRYNTPGWAFWFINFEKHCFRHPYGRPINPKFFGGVVDM